MRHLPMILGAAMLSLCLFAPSGQASAAPLAPLNAANNAAAPLETVGYRRWYRRGYRRGYPYWGGPYWRPYGYYRPYWYGYKYRPYRRYGWGY